MPTLTKSEIPSISTAPTNSPTVSNKPTTTLSLTPSTSSAPSISSSPSPEPTSYATIGPNVVFDDENGNGKREAVEGTLANVTVNLYCYNENGTAILEGTATTDFYGEYFINYIQPGLCYIHVVPPTGGQDNNETYVFSPIGKYCVGYTLLKLCSHVDVSLLRSISYHFVYLFSTVPDGNQIYPNGTSPEVQLDWNDNITTWDVGVYLPVTIGNKVWEDLNGNGIQDVVNGTIVEEGMAGIQVTLLDTNNDPVATTISAGDGSYWFTNLPPGDYAVRIGPVPPDFVFAGAPIDCLQGMSLGALYITMFSGFSVSSTHIILPFLNYVITRERVGNERYLLQYDTDGLHGC